MLWAITVVASLVSLSTYLGFHIFIDTPKSKAKPDRFEVLLETPAESLRIAVETGQGKGQGPIARETQPSGEVQLPKAPTSDALIRSALFSRKGEDEKEKAVDQENEHDRVEAQLANIERELSQLPGGIESAPARAVLLHTASTLNLDDREADQVHEMAMNELLQGSDSQFADQTSSSSFAFFLPILAHEVALKTALDADEALAVTMDGLSVHQDPAVRYSMMKQFVSRYPDRELQLREQLYFRQLQSDASVYNLSVTTVSNSR